MAKKYARVIGGEYSGRLGKCAPVVNVTPVIVVLDFLTLRRRTYFHGRIGQFIFNRKDVEFISEREFFKEKLRRG